MSKLQTLSIAFFIAIISLASNASGNQPTDKDVMLVLQSTFPPFIQVDSLHLDNSERTDTDDKSVVKSTFRGILLAAENLYVDSKMIGDKIVLRKLYDKDTEFTVSGKSNSVFNNDKWKVKVSGIKITPEPKGSPLSNLAEGTYVISGSDEEKRLIEAQMPFIDFMQSQELDNWVIVNDTVMGGRSNSRVDIKDGTFSFSGLLSLENNGGFASVRRVENGKQWLSNKSIQIEVKGDGREYKLRFRTNQGLDGVSYSASFKTKSGETSVFQFNASDFVPQYRGRLVPDAPALDFANISQLGFLLGDGNPGEFTLLVKRISQLSE